MKDCQDHARGENLFGCKLIFIRGFWSINVYGLYREGKQCVMREQVSLLYLICISSISGSILNPIRESDIVFDHYPQHFKKFV